MTIYVILYTIKLDSLANLVKRELGVGIMIVSSTEVQNNFGSYLMFAAKEPVTITKNGVVVAQLISLLADSNEKMKDLVVETRLTSKYTYGGKEASYEEYLGLVKNSENRYEYIDGEIYILSSPKTIHQNTLQELHVKFYNYFQGKKCSTMFAPYDITLKRHEEDQNIVQPDMMVICDLEEYLDERDYYMGIPDLVVEIISKSTISKDMVKKLDLYMKCGVGEYWIINPYKKEIYVYLFKDKEIEDFKTFCQSETVNSFSFKGLEVNLTEIFN